MKSCMNTLLDIQEVQKKLKPSKSSLAGFFGEISWPVGVINLDVTLGNYPNCITVTPEFEVVKSYSKYNVLLERPKMHKFGVIVSTVHSLVKFQTRRDIATIKGNVKLLQ